VIDFSKVKSLSIPQGKVKDISIAGVKVWKEQTTPTYTVSGVWVFFDYIYLDWGGIREREATVTFTSNGVSFTKMTAKMGNGLYYEDSLIFNPAKDVWTNNAYKTVDFGLEEQSVSEEFYTWLTANASRKQISFTIDGTSYQAYDGMTWEEWVNSSFNTDGYNLGFSVVMFRGGGIVEYSNGDTVRPTDIIMATNYILGSHGGGSGN
jgi:hypothetical protein